MRVTKLLAEFSEQHQAFLLTICAVSDGMEKTNHAFADLIPAAVDGANLDDVQRSINKGLMLLRRAEEGPL